MSEVILYSSRHIESAQGYHGASFFLMPAVIFLFGLCKQERKRQAIFYELLGFKKDVRTWLNLGRPSMLCGPRHPCWAVQFNPAA